MPRLSASSKVLPTVAMSPSRMRSPLGKVFTSISEISSGVSPGASARTCFSTVPDTVPDGRSRVLRATAVATSSMLVPSRTSVVSGTAISISRSRMPVKVTLSMPRSSRSSRMRRA